MRGAGVTEVRLARSSRFSQTSRFCVLENSIALKAKHPPGAQGFWVYFLPFLPEAWIATRGGQGSSLRLQEQGLAWELWGGGWPRLPSALQLVTCSPLS